MDPAFPLPLSAYPLAGGGASLLDILRSRIEVQPFNLVATVIFGLAILHTFMAKRLTVLAHHTQLAHEARQQAAGQEPSPSIKAEFLHFLGEVEVIFGLWAVVLAGAMAWFQGLSVARHYFNDSVNYTEALFVFVIMALASTQPVLDLAEDVLRRIAALGKGSPLAWWLTLLTVTPLLGSLITEPAAMTLAALMLRERLYAAGMSQKLKYATLGVLFVNVSIGGALTPFAAPPVLMVAGKWNWDLFYMFTHFGWKLALAVCFNAGVAALVFRRELVSLETTRAEASSRVPMPVLAIHLLFLVGIVVFAHHPAAFLGLFLFFMGFATAYPRHQDRLILREGLLVAFFLAGLVVLGGQQQWWLEPLLRSLNADTVYFGAAALTAVTNRPRQAATRSASRVTPCSGRSASGAK